jgi:hypothetical protein
MESILSLTKDMLAILKGRYENFIAFFRPPPPPPRPTFGISCLSPKAAITLALVLVVILSVCFAIWYKKVSPALISLHKQAYILKQRKSQKTLTDTSTIVSTPNSILALEDLSLLLSFLCDIRIEESSKKLESISIEVKIYLHLVYLLTFIFLFPFSSI